MENDQPTIVLLAAFCDEVAPALRALGLRLNGCAAVGQFRTVRVIAQVTGIGGPRAVGALSPLLAASPDLVIHAGFAGGLDPILRLGDVLRIGAVVNEAQDAINLEASHDGAPPMRLLTVDQIADSPSAKQTLYAASRAHAVDMETYYVARLCREHQTRLASLRVISDPADVTLPMYISRWINEDGSTNGCRAAWDLASRPWRLPTMCRLGRDTRLASKRLAEEIIPMIEYECGRLGR